MPSAPGWPGPAWRGRPAEAAGCWLPVIAAHPRPAQGGEVAERNPAATPCGWWRERETLPTATPSAATRFGTRIRQGPPGAATSGGPLDQHAQQGGGWSMSTLAHPAPVCQSVSISVTDRHKSWPDEGPMVVGTARRLDDAPAGGNRADGPPAPR